MINTAGNRGGSSVFIDQREWTKTKENKTVDIKTLTLLEICLEFIRETISRLKICAKIFSIN